ADLARRPCETVRAAPGRRAVPDPRLYQRTADAAATPGLVHRDVEQVHLVGDAPAAAVADEHGARVGLLDRHRELREGRRQFLLEEGARPGLPEGAPLDLEHRGQVVAAHGPQDEGRAQVAPPTFGSTTSSVLSR